MGKLRKFADWVAVGFATLGLSLLGAIAVLVGIALLIAFNIGLVTVFIKAISYVLFGLFDVALLSWTNSLKIATALYLIKWLLNFLLSSFQPKAVEAKS